MRGALIAASALALACLALPSQPASALGELKGAWGKKPTLSGCGTSPAVVGDTEAGEVTVGTSATGCVLTFERAFPTSPSSRFSCVVTSQGGVVFTYSVSSTALTLVNSGDLSGTKLDYRCRG